MEVAVLTTKDKQQEQVLKGGVHCPRVHLATNQNIGSFLLQRCKMSIPWPRHRPCSKLTKTKFKTITRMMIQFWDFEMSNLAFYANAREWRGSLMDGVKSFGSLHGSSSSRRWDTALSIFHKLNVKRMSWHSCSKLFSVKLINIARSSLRHGALDLNICRISLVESESVLWIFALLLENVEY